MNSVQCRSVKDTLIEILGGEKGESHLSKINHNFHHLGNHQREDETHEETILFARGRNFLSHFVASLERNKYSDPKIETGGGDETLEGRLNGQTDADGDVHRRHFLGRKCPEDGDLQDVEKEARCRYHQELLDHPLSLSFAHLHLGGALMQLVKENCRDALVEFER